LVQPRLRPIGGEALKQVPPRVVFAFIMIWTTEIMAALFAGFYKLMV
jgi:hypothetical protein